VTEPSWGLAEDDRQGLRGVDVILNVAGLVSLNPALDESLRINAHGALEGAKLAVALGARLVHVSTCYVAGYRRGVVREDEEIAGYYPKRSGLGAFDAAAELAAADRFIAETAAKAKADLAGKFGGKPRLAKRWADERLIVDGRRRARHWGWPNIYCFTKSMGEQLIARVPGLQYSIVRPSIVESALQFPFPGWNEGLTTSAPVILAMATGHVLWPAHPTAALDVIPVDLVAGAILLAAGAILRGAGQRVYHVGSSDTNPMSVVRCMRFVGAYRRRAYRDHAPGRLWAHWLRTRLRLRTVPGAVYKTLGVPAYRRFINGTAALWERAGGRVPRAVQRLSRELAGVEHVIETFYPFIHDIDCVFKTDNLAALTARLPEAERAALPWSPARIDWRSYWFEVHTEGLRKWVFPGFQDKMRMDHFRRSWPVRGIRWVMGALQRGIYGGFFRVRVTGAENIPMVGGYLVASNHESHLDMGLIKHALGYRTVISLAAKDYFFDTPWKAFIISNFTNLLPFNRRTRLKESLQVAGQVLADGYPLLIFPEGTRTADGRMLPFKPSLGFLALNNNSDVLPVFIDGAFEALPKGTPLFLPKRRSLDVAIGPAIKHEELVKLTAGLPNNEAYRVATARVEQAVRALSDAGGGEPARASISLGDASLSQG
jgi:1-acyl-sn-glycerol-3-phosphate acyltransferase